MVVQANETALINFQTLNKKVIGSVEGKSFQLLFQLVITLNSVSLWHGRSPLWLGA